MQHPARSVTGNTLIEEDKVFGQTRIKNSSLTIFKSYHGQPHRPHMLRGVSSRTVTLSESIGSPYIRRRTLRRNCK